MPWVMHLRQSAPMSARRLGADAIDLSYLHSGRAKSAPFLHHLAVLAELRQQHLVKHITLNRDQLHAWIAECREATEQMLRILFQRIGLITCCLMSIEFVDLSQLVAKRLLQRAKQIDIRGTIGYGWPAISRCVSSVSLPARMGMPSTRLFGTSLIVAGSVWMTTV